MHAAIGGVCADVARWHVAMPTTNITGHDDTLLLSQGDGRCCDQKRRDRKRLENISHFHTPIGAEWASASWSLRRSRRTCYFAPNICSLLPWTEKAPAIDVPGQVGRTDRSRIRPFPPCCIA